MGIALALASGTEDPVQTSAMTFRPTLSAVLLACAGTAFAQADKLGVDNAWARPTVPGQVAGGGYLSIQNKGGADRLLAASADVARSVEMHRMSMEGEVMKMRQLEALDIPAGKTVELKPGGLHLMFIGLKEPLKVGTSFPLTLRFEKAGELKVQVKVMTAPAAAHDAGHKH